MAQMTVKGKLDPREYQQGVEKLKRSNEQVKSDVDSTGKRMRKALNVKPTKPRLDSRNYEGSIDRLKRKTEQLGESGKRSSREVKRGLESVGSGATSAERGVLRLKRAIQAAAKATVIVALIDAVVKLATAFGGAVRNARELSDLSEQAGVGVERFQQLGAAVLATGEDLDTLRDALGAIKTAQGEVLRGDEGMLKEFQQLGISIDDLTNKSPDELFEDMGKAIKESGNSAAEFSAVAKIIGEGDALKLQQGLKAAAGGADELANSYKVLSAEQVATLDALDAKTRRVGNNIKTFFNGIAAGIASLFVNKKDVEKTLAAQKESERLTERARRSTAAETAEKKRLETVEKIAAAEEKAAASRSKQVEQIERSVKIEVDTDSIRRIGGFAGSRVSDSLRLARRQVDILSQIAQLDASTLPKIEENTRTQGLA